MLQTESCHFYSVKRISSFALRYQKFWSQTDKTPALDTLAKAEEFF